jgi:hypothetical protein
LEGLAVVTGLFRQRYIGVALTVWVIAATAVAAPDPAPNEDSVPTVGLTRGSTPSKPLYIDTTCDDHDRKSDCNRGWWSKLFTDPIELFTAGLVAIGFLQVFYTAAAFRESRRANEAARDAELNTSTALIITNRPYVFVRDFVPIAVGNPEQPMGWQCVVIWENSGATPTQNLRMWMSWATFTQPIPTDFDFADRGDTSQQSITIIPPRGQVTAPIFVLDRELAGALAAGNLFTYIWGWAEYSDIFPNTPKRRTEFCVQVLVDFIGTDPPRMMVQFRHYPRHNLAT